MTVLLELWIVSSSIILLWFILVVRSYKHNRTLTFDNNAI